MTTKPTSPPTPPPAQPPQMRHDLSLEDYLALQARAQPTTDRCGHRLEPLSDEQVSVLLNDLTVARIAHRSQGGANLSYLEGWDVKATLIRVFGFGGWSSELLEYHTENVNREAGKNHNLLGIAMSARISLHIHQLGAWYTEGAVSEQTGPIYGDVADFALKTAETDALKRGAISLGTQFGLSLYDKGSTKDVVRVVLAPAQKGARARFLESVKGDAPVIDDAPTNPIEPEKPGWEGQSEGGALPADTPDAAAPEPAAAEQEMDPTTRAARARRDWATDAMRLNTYAEVLAFHAEATTAGAAPKALEAIAAWGSSLRKKETEETGIDPKTTLRQRANSMDRLQGALKRDVDTGSNGESDHA